MRQSQLFTKTRKEAPKDEVAKNAALLIRAGFVHKDLAGVYSFLPLGVRVLNKIIGIIREEMNAIGGEELHLAALQDKAIWEDTGRWDDKTVDVWFKSELKNGTQVGLAPTHEEPVTMIMKDHISSYRDLPRFVYQFQTKFRNETRAKSGIMRSREFLMKDLYSFSADEKSHAEFYEKAKVAYTKIFDRVGLGEKTFLTEASGGSFSPRSHEFQTLCDAGEDTIYVTDEAGKKAVNNEIVKEPEVASAVAGTKGRSAIEVGNIFNLGTRFSEALGLTFLDQTGKPQPVVMGSYGIGPARVMGTIVEVLSDERGIVWPESVAPFKVHLIHIPGAEETTQAAETLYKNLKQSGVDVLFDDRDARAGEKFADADLIGIPYRVVVSDKTLKAGGVEIKKRTEEAAKIIPENSLITELSG